jgi:hypothetical protein
MARQQQMSNNQISLAGGNQQITGNDIPIVGDACQTLGTKVVAKFEIGYIDIHHAGQQFEGFGCRVKIGLPDDRRQIVDFRHHFQNGGQMDGRLAAHPLNIPSALCAPPIQCIGKKGNA